MKNILVPIDFSGSPNRLINYAISLGQQLKCKLLFLHSASLLIPTALTREAYETDAEKEIYSTENILFDKIARYCDLHGIQPSQLQIEYEIRFGSNVTKDILDAAKEKKADMILLSTHGRAGVKKFLFGNTASTVISESHLPVLTIPLNYEFRPVSLVVYASDLCDPLNELNAAKYFSKRLQADLEMVNFNYGTTTPDDSVIKLARTAGVPLKESLMSIEYPLIDHIRKYMKHKKDAILCLFVGHHSKLAKLLGESYTERMIGDLKFPLLAIPKTGANSNY